MCHERCAAYCRASSAICFAPHLNSELLRRHLSEARAVVAAAKRAPYPTQGVRRAMFVRRQAHHTVFVSSTSPLELGGQEPPAENCAGSRQLQRPRLTHMVGKHAFK